MTRATIAMRCSMAAAMCIFGALPCTAAVTTAKAKDTSMPTTAPCKVVRDGSKVFIAGLEQAEWGNASFRQNSMMGATEAAMLALGEPVSYEYLMGVSGAAFRIQIMQPDPCPSSPHACVGFNCFQPALKALGYSVTSHDLKADDAEGLAKVRKIIVESIDRGRPVLSLHEECGLVVGYIDGGQELLVRPYSPKSYGYRVMKTQPWGFGIFNEKQPAPSRHDSAIRSLQIAVETAKTAKFGNYASGFAAYEAWMAWLLDDDKFDKLDPAAMRAATRANGYCYGCLENARSCAVAYLKSLNGEFKGRSADHLANATAVYQKIHAMISARRDDIECPWSLMPWDLKDGWKRSQRHTQAAVLKAMLALEKDAINELEQLLAAEGAATKPVP